jgi:medium-chain acyl-[acyl-carrier-protein] hydrolase
MDCLRFFPRPRVGAQLLLVCVPPAGGSPSAFASWTAQLPPWLDLCAVTLPGREARLREPFAASVADVADEAADAIGSLDRSDMPVAMLGHSLGGWVALETTRRLIEDGTQVVHLFALASRPPHVMGRRVIGGDDASLIAYLRELGGTPEVVFAEPSLLAIMLPILRADLGILERHPLRTVPVDVPATIMTGLEDPTISVELAERWRELVGRPPGRGDHVKLAGGHFFPQTARDQVIATVIDKLAATR